MKTLRTLFKPLLALLMLVSAVPAWACVRACNGGTTSLHCVRLCAHSKALLTEDGKLASVGASACSVKAVDAAPTVVVNAFHLSAPSLQALPLVPALLPPPTITALADAGTRGPPQPHSYLSSQHPFANGPPTLL